MKLNHHKNLLSAKGLHYMHASNHSFSQVVLLLQSIFAVPYHIAIFCIEAPSRTHFIIKQKIKTAKLMKIQVLCPKLSFHE